MKAYLCLGANLGDPQQQVRKALECIAATQGIEILHKSTLALTEPYGVSGQPWFWNQVLEVETTLDPSLLLEKLLTIERELGRVRGEKWAPRLIDIDILLYEDQVLETDTLTVPHPDLHNRLFALRLLCELIPDALHPKLHKPFHILLNELEAREENL